MSFRLTVRRYALQASDQAVRQSENEVERHAVP